MWETGSLADFRGYDIGVEIVRIYLAILNQFLLYKCTLVTLLTIFLFSDKVFYRVDLEQQLGAGRETEIDIDTAYSHSLRPYPSEITQAEKQFVQFTTNAYFYSPYKTTEQESTVKCASSGIESFTKVEPSSSSESEINYGSYQDIQSFSNVNSFFMSPMSPYAAGFVNILILFLYTSATKYIFTHLYTLYIK